MIIAAASLARKTTAPMISSTSPRRPSLILLSIQARRTGSAKVLSLSFVWMKVGAIELTRIWCRPSFYCHRLGQPFDGVFACTIDGTVDGTDMAHLRRNTG